MQKMWEQIPLITDDGEIPCPDCEAEIDYEIGPDESMEDILDTAQLLRKSRVKKKSKRWMLY